MNEGLGSEGMGSDSGEEASSEGPLVRDGGASEASDFSKLMRVSM